MTLGQIKERLFCEASKRYVELVFGAVALGIFVLHILAIGLAKINIIDQPLLASASFISTIASPLTVILIGEMYLLVRSYTKPLLFSLIFQVEVISLIFIRDIFKIFASFDTLDSSSISSNLAQVFVTLVIGSVLFTTALALEKYANKGQILTKPESKQLSTLRIFIATVLLVAGIGILIHYIATTILPDPVAYLVSGGSLISFFQSVFTLMILADVLLFLINFINNDEYLSLFTNVIYLVSAILLRLSLTAEFPINVSLVILSVISALGITLIGRKLTSDKPLAN